MLAGIAEQIGLAEARLAIHPRCADCTARRYISLAREACREKQLVPTTFYVMQAFAIGIQRKCAFPEMIAPAAFRLVESCHARGLHLPMMERELIWTVRSPARSAASSP